MLIEMENYYRISNPSYYNYGVIESQQQFYTPYYNLSSSPDATNLSYDSTSSSMDSLYSSSNSSSSATTINYEEEKGFRRVSVIVKAENCRVKTSSQEERRVISIEHVCRWENCYRIFETLEKLANHVNISHSSIGINNLYYCKWEGCQRQEKGFNARYKMLIHCRTHTKEKPHKCKFSGCTKSFSRAENLKIHVRSHTFEKPYQCNFPGCTKAYSNSSDRFKHSRTHQNGKPYVCKVIGCMKRYTDPSSLRKHLKTFNHDSLKQIDVIDSKKLENVEIIRPSNEYFWIKQSESLINSMEIIKIDQPLDLRINI